MEIHKPSIVFPLHFLLLFSSITTLLEVINGQILPSTVNAHGGNATTKYQAYIVHVQKPRRFKFQTFRDRKDWYMSFLPNTTLDSEEPRMIYAYRRAINGFAAMLTREELEAMKSKSGFLLAHEDGELQLRTTYTPTFLGLEGAWGGLMEDADYGSGQIIAMIDSGIKFDHPSFDGAGMPPPPPRWRGACFWKKNGCNDKLIGAVGYKHGNLISPIDDDGHGTHTASTAAGRFIPDANILGNAQGTASGTAPGAHLAVYKVIGGSTSDILKGIDEAIRDRVDVLSMSLGYSGPRAFHEDVIAKASFAAITENIVPVQAGGNDGPSFSLVDGAPWILTVGSSTTDRTITATVKLGDGREFLGESAYQPGDFPPTQLPLVYPFAILNTDESKTCDSLWSLDDVTGKIVLCSASYTEGNVEVGKRVKREGGAAVIIMSESLNGNRTDADAHFLPASHVPFNASLQIIDYYNTNKTPTATIIFEGTQFGFRPAPVVSSLSNRGPNLFNGNIIKPDIIAPGSNILAAWPREVGPTRTGTKKTFAMESGTSMAAPHVSGIVALLRHNHPDWSAAAIKSAIMTTADTTDNEGNPIKDQYDGKNAGAFTMGSGQVNPTAADTPGLIYDIEPHDYIRYLCGMKTLSDSQVSAIVRGPIACSQVHAIDPEQLNYPSISVSLGPNSMAKNITRTVTSVADGSSVYTVQFDNPEGVNVDVYPDKLQFSQRDEKQDFVVALSIQGMAPKAGKISEGRLSWDSGEYLVRSPIVVTFT